MYRIIKRERANFFVYVLNIAPYTFYWLNPDSNKTIDTILFLKGIKFKDCDIPIVEITKDVYDLLNPYIFNEMSKMDLTALLRSL